MSRPGLVTSIKRALQNAQVYGWDLHLRLTNEFVNQKNLNILGAGYTYYFSDQVRLTPGYAYVTQYGLIPERTGCSRASSFATNSMDEKKKGFNGP